MRGGWFGEWWVEVYVEERMSELMIVSVDGGLYGWMDEYISG